EADPRGERAGEAGPRQADGHADLAGRGTRKELTERDDVCVGRLFKPAPARDEFVAEVAEMGDGAAERDEAEAQERHQDLDPGAASGQRTETHVERPSSEAPSGAPTKEYCCRSRGEQRTDEFGDRLVAKRRLLAAVI